MKIFFVFLLAAAASSFKLHADLNPIDFWCRQECTFLIQVYPKDACTNVACAIEHQAKQSDCQSMCEICQEYCRDELKTNTNMKNCMINRKVQYCDVQVPIKTYDTCYNCVSKQEKPLRNFLEDNVFTTTKMETVFMRKFKLVNNKN